MDDQLRFSIRMMKTLCAQCHKGQRAERQQRSQIFTHQFQMSPLSRRLRCPCTLHFYRRQYNTGAEVSRANIIAAPPARTIAAFTAAGSHVAAETPGRTGYET